MKKFIYSLSLLCLSLAILSCDQDHPKAEQPAQQEAPVTYSHYIYFSTQSELQSTPITKMEYVESDSKLGFKWEADDVIQIGFVQGEGIDAPHFSGYISIPEENINENGEIIDMPIAIPDGYGFDFDQPIDMYIVYGPENTLLWENRGSKGVYTVNFPRTFITGVLKANLKDAKLPMVHFKTTIQEPKTSPKVIGKMQHLGAFFLVSVRNETGSNWDGYKYFRLNPNIDFNNSRWEVPNDQWQIYAYNNGDWLTENNKYFGSKYNLTDGVAEPNGNKAYSPIPFGTEFQIPRTQGAIATFWVWMPVIDGATMPKMYGNLSNYQKYGLNNYKTSFYRPQRTIHVGKVYRYYLGVNRNSIFFCKRDWTPITVQD